MAKRYIEIALQIRYIVIYIGVMRNRYEPHPPHDHIDDARHGRGHHGHRRGGRPFDNGELRLVILQLIADSPRHGYELMKEIEDRLGGTYSPSPGVIYPTLSLLEELGHATVEASAAGKKLYTVTQGGRDFLAANKAAVEAVFARLGARGDSRGGPPPDQLVRAMENLKLALRLKLSSGPLHPSQIDTISTALDQATVTIERAAVPSTPQG
jgi:DNA-binding PadR family transcriptional regulator